MTFPIDKENFINRINSIPIWVENVDDLIRFCKYLQFLLMKEEDLKTWYEIHFETSEEQRRELLQIELDFYREYLNEKTDFKNINELFDCKKDSTCL